MAQRFISGLEVFDTYSGRMGSISEMKLQGDASSPLSLLWVGPYFVVDLTSIDRQMFTIAGQRIEHLTGVSLNGVTLLTQKEYQAILAAGYPRF